MRLHVRFIDFKLWKIIEHENYIPMDPRTNEPKHEMNFNYEDEKMMSLKAKAINILFCDLDATKFNHIS